MDNLSQLEYYLLQRSNSVYVIIHTLLDRKIDPWPVLLKVFIVKVGLPGIPYYHLLEEYLHTFYYGNQVVYRDLNHIAHLIIELDRQEVECCLKPFDANIPDTIIARIMMKLCKKIPLYIPYLVRYAQENVRPNPNPTRPSFVMETIPPKVKYTPFELPYPNTTQWWIQFTDLELNKMDIVMDKYR